MGHLEKKKQLQNTDLVGLSSERKQATNLNMRGVHNAMLFETSRHFVGVYHSQGHFWGGKDCSIVGSMLGSSPLLETYHVLISPREWHMP